MSAARRSPLQDLRGFVRWMVFWQLLGPGVALGALSVSAVVDVRIGSMLAVAAVGLLLIVGWSVGTVVRMRRMDSALRERVARGGSEILTGSVTSVPAPARVLRQRAARRSTPQLLGGQASGAADIAVLTALLADGPRRLAAAVPRSAGLRPGRTVVVAVHPVEPDVAVLDARVAPADLASAEADPRWVTEKLPTDASVAGGWAVLPVWGLAGLVLGAVPAAAAVALLS